MTLRSEQKGSACYHPQSWLYLANTRLPTFSVRIDNAQISELTECSVPIGVDWAVLAVINAGTSAGSVTGSAVHLQYLPQTDGPHLPDLAKNDIIYLRRYDVGSSDNAIPVSTDRWGGLNHVNATVTGKMLYFSGWVVYEDERGYARTTYFCRQFSRFPGSNVDGRFIPIDDPECEKTY